MFKFIGGVVVCGFALYGLVQYLEQPRVKVLFHSAGSRNGETVAGDSVRDEAAPSPAESAAEETSEGEPTPDAG